MPTIPYKLADGKTRVPGVTTIIGARKEIGGLMHWAWKQGCDGLDYRQSRDSAADAGTQAHELVENRIHEREVNLEGCDPRAVECYRSFIEWERMHELVIEHSERHLVSESLRFGGTPDHEGTAAGVPCVIDIKTSNGVYVDHLIQLSAYCHLIEECGGMPPIERVHLLRLGKEDASFHHHSWGMETMQKAFEVFKHMRAQYDLLAELKRAV